MFFYRKGAEAQRVLIGLLRIGSVVFYHKGAKMQRGISGLSVNKFSLLFVRQFMPKPV